MKNKIWRQSTNKHNKNNEPDIAFVCPPEAAL